MKSYETLVGDDWRLQGQDQYLKGAALTWSKYTKYREGWDHDHCEFCGVEFAEAPRTGILNEGYTTADRYRWICKACFEDFKFKFEWTVK